MKVVFVHQYFVDPGSPAATRPFDLVRALVGRGHEVVVVTGDLHLQTRERITMRAHDVGARVVSVRLFSGYGRSLLLRLVNHLDFLIKAIKVARKEHDARIYYGSALPIFAALAAAVASRGRGSFVFELRDLFPESLESVAGLTSRLGRLLFRPIVAWLYRSAALVVVVSPAFVPFVRAHGVPADRIVVVPHGADVELFRPVPQPDPDLHVVYTGALGQAQGVETFAAVAERLPPDVRILVYGDGPHASALRAAAGSLPNVEWRGSLPKEQMPAVVGAAAICLLLLRNVPIFRTVYPNKLFEYMAAGRPTIVTFEGIAAELLTSRDAGVLAVTADEIASQIVRLRDNHELRRSMGEAARRVVTHEFDRATLMSGLVRDLEARFDC